MSTVKIKLKNKQITAKLIPDKTNDKVMFIHKFLEIPKQIEACYISLYFIIINLFYPFLRTLYLLKSRLTEIFQSELVINTAFLLTNITR